MQTIKIPIDKGYLPDFIPFNMPEGGLVDCKNLLPYNEYWSPALDKVAYSSTAVSGVPRSVAEFRADDGNRYQFIGTTTKIYRLETDKSLTDVSLAGGYATLENTWNWTQYGQWVLAVNYDNVPQVLKTFATGSAFANLAGSPPQAKYILFNNGHVIMGYTYESSTAYPQRIRWSAFENPESWTVSLTTGADYQDLSDTDGEITGLANVGSSFLIFSRNSVSLGWYAGAPLTFNFAINKFKNIGAIPGTIVSIGSRVYFWDEKSLYVTDGVTCEALGTGVRSTITAEINVAYYHRITVAHDIRHSLIYWAYPTIDSTDGTVDKILVYNYQTNRFSYIDLDLYCIFPMYTGVMLLDDMDATYPSVDSIPYTIDSSKWLANNPVIACMDSDDDKVATFTGSALAGEIETGDIVTFDINQISRIRPKVKNPTASTLSVRAGYRMVESDSVSYSSSVYVDTSGVARVRNTGRLLRVELTTGANDGIAQFIEADMNVVGKR